MNKELLDTDVLLSMMEDIEEERKRVEESEEKYRLMTEMSPDGIAIMDNKGVITACNQSFADIPDCTKEELIGKRFTKLPFLHLEEIPRCIKIFHSLLKGEKIGPIDMRWIDKKGRTRFAEVVATPIKKENRISGIQAISRDITEKKRSEEEKERLRKQLELYAKKLEIKLKKLEKHKPNLTYNEKLVLWGLTRYPDDNDDKLSKKLKINRSTLTAIKNRLRKKDIYYTINIPDFSILGAELLTFVYGNLSPGFEKRKEIREEILEHATPFFTVHTDTKFLDGIISKDLVDFEKKKSFALSRLYESKALKDFKVIHFLNSVDTTHRFFDYSSLLKNHFNIGIEEKKEKKEAKENNKPLNKNEKKVLMKMVEFPELSAYDISFKVNLTRTTVAKIKDKLIKKRYITKKIIPNTNKIGLELTAFTHIKHNISDRAPIENSLKTDSSFVFLAEGINETAGISKFKDKDNCDLFINTVQSQGQDSFLETPFLFKIMTKDIKIIILDFTEITKRLLES